MRETDHTQMDRFVDKITQRPGLGTVWAVWAVGGSAGLG